MVVHSPVDRLLFCVYLRPAERERWEAQQAALEREKQKAWEEQAERRKEEERLEREREEAERKRHEQEEAEEQRLWKERANRQPFSLGGVGLGDCTVYKISNFEALQNKQFPGGIL